MKKGRIWRNLGSLIMGIFITIILIEFHITPKKICNYTDVISGVLSMTSISTSFIFASFTLIPALPNSKLMKSLKELGTDKKLLDRLLLTMIGFSICSIIALIGLTFDKDNNTILSLTIVSLVGGTLGFSLSEEFKVFRILIKGVEIM